VISLDSFENYLVTYELIEVKNMKYKSYNDNFFKLGEVEYSNFVINAYSTFVFLIAVMMIIFVVTIAEFLMKECSAWRSKLLIIVK